VMGMSDHRKRLTFSPVPFATFATLASLHSQRTVEPGRISSSPEAGCRRYFGREVKYIHIFELVVYVILSFRKNILA